MSPREEGDAGRRRRDNWTVISVLATIVLVLVAFYLIPQSLVGISFALYGVAFLLATVTFVVPAIALHIRRRRAANESKSDTENS